MGEPPDRNGAFPRLTDEQRSRLRAIGDVRSVETGDILFRGALEDLKDRYLGRFSVFHVLSREQQDVDVLNGRLDQEKLALLLRRIVGGLAIDHAYVCGPLGMVAGVEAVLAQHGVPADHVHVERFTSALQADFVLPEDF